MVNVASPPEAITAPTFWSSAPCREASRLRRVAPSRVKEPSVRTKLFSRPWPSSVTSPLRVNVPPAATWTNGLALPVTVGAAPSAFVMVMTLPAGIVTVPVRAMSPVSLIVVASPSVAAAMAASRSASSSTVTVTASKRAARGWDVDSESESSAGAPCWSTWAGIELPSPVAVVVPPGVTMPNARIALNR